MIGTRGRPSGAFSGLPSLRLVLCVAALVLPALLVLTLPGADPSTIIGPSALAGGREAFGLGSGGRARAESANEPTPAELGYALSHGLTLRSAVWAAQALTGWIPFGPPLESRWDVRRVSQTTTEPLITDDQFVWGPNVGLFDAGAFLESRGSKLAEYAGDLELWAAYSSVNPQVLLAVLELRYGLVDQMPDGAEPALIRDQIETTALDLATAFYEHLYTWGARRDDSCPDRRVAFAGAGRWDDHRPRRRARPPDPTPCSRSWHRAAPFPIGRRSPRRRPQAGS